MMATSGSLFPPCPEGKYLMGFMFGCRCFVLIILRTIQVSCTSDTIKIFYNKLKICTFLMQSVNINKALITTSHELLIMSSSFKKQTLQQGLGSYSVFRAYCTVQTRDVQTVEYDDNPNYSVLHNNRNNCNLCN